MVASYFFAILFSLGIDFQPSSSGDIAVASSSSLGCQSSPENNHHVTHPFSSQSEGKKMARDTWSAITKNTLIIRTELVYDAIGKQQAT